MGFWNVKTKTIREPDELQNNELHCIKNLNKQPNMHYLVLVYAKLILVRMWRKLLAYRNTLESAPGTNQYCAISVKFLAQWNNGLSFTGFEPMRLAILRLLVQRVNHSTTKPPHGLIWFNLGCVLHMLEIFNKLYRKTLRVCNNHAQ